MEEMREKIASEKKRDKLENPARVAELSPAETLRRAGVKKGETLADIGAGSGLFSLAAAGLGAHVFAADLDGELLADLQARARKSSLDVQTLTVSGCDYPLPAACADWAVLVTVLHEIDDRDGLFRELRRILKPGGRVCLVEFHKRRTPMGPPPEHRIAPEEAGALFSQAGFQPADGFALGDNFYCRIYARQEEKAGD